MYNLLKMERYQLIRSRVYWGGVIGVFLIGFLTAETYVPEVMGPGGGAAAGLADILDGMVYDSTFLLIVVSCLLAVCMGREFSWRTVDAQIGAGHSRRQVFLGKSIVYLAAFNLMALVYPIAGCIREMARFGIGDPILFLQHLGKDIVYSVLLNSTIFLIPIICCICFQNVPKALGVTASVTFISVLYLGYGMMLHFPVWFLPTFQIREAVTGAGFFMPVSAAVGVIWFLILVLTAWNVFRKCDLK